MPYVKRKVKDLRVGDHIDFEVQVFQDLLKWNIAALQEEIDNEDESDDELSEDAQALWEAQDVTFEIDQEPEEYNGQELKGYLVSTDHGAWVLDGDAVLQTEQWYEDDEEIE